MGQSSRGTGTAADQPPAWLDPILSRELRDIADRGESERVEFRLGLPERERNLIERFFSKLKHFQRIATRHDKLAANFLTMVQLASMRLWLRVYEPTA